MSCDIGVLWLDTQTDRVGFGVRVSTRDDYFVTVSTDGYRDLFWCWVSDMENFWLAVAHLQLPICLISSHGQLS